MEGAVTYANQKWREITSLEGDHRDSAAEESFLKSVHPDDREVIAGLWRTALKNTESCSFETRWGTPDSFRWAMGELVPEIIGDEVRFSATKLTTDVRIHWSIDRRDRAQRNGGRKACNCRRSSCPARAGDWYSQF
jgi:PAS domain-containing protein